MAVQFRFTGDDKDVQRALQAMEKRYNDLINAAKKGTDETKKMADAAKRVFEETRTPLEKYNARLKELQALAKSGAASIEDVGRAAKMARTELEQAQKGEGGGGGLAAMGLRAAAAYASVGAAIAYVNSELARKRELEKSASDQQTEMANRQREALINLGTATAQERKEILGGLGGISAKTGVKQSDLMAALPGLTSAQGALTTQQMMSALEMAARIAPHNAETMGELALGLENTASLTGSKDMTENMGFQLGIGRGTQIKNLGDINRYLIRGAIGVKGFGGSATDAAAIVSTLTSAMKDPEGRLSQTAGISMAQQLAEAFPEKDSFKVDDKGRRKLDARGTGMTSTAERIAFLQGNQQAREDFMAKASFEHQAFIPIREMLTAGSETAGILETRKKEIPLGAAATGIAQDFLGTLENEPMQRGAQSGRAGAAVVEETMLKDTKAAYNGRVRDLMIQELTASGTGTFLTGLGFDLSPEDAASYAIGALGNRRIELERDRAMPGAWGDVQGRVNQATTRIEGIEKMINVLEGIRDNQRNRNQDRHAE